MLSKSFKYRKPILQNEKLEVPRRVSLAHSLMFSSGLYNCAVWPSPTMAEISAIHKPIMSVSRSIAGATFSKKADYVHRSDMDVMASLQVPVPTTIVRAARFRLAIRLAKAKPSEIIMLVVNAWAADRSWLRSLLTDLEWAASRDERVRTLGFSSLAQWWQWMRHESGKAGSLLAEVCARYREVDLAIPNHRTGISRLVVPVQHTCPECGEVRKSATALAVHRLQLHAIRSRQSYYTSGSQCVICVREFSTRACHVEHLQKSPICWANVLHRIPPLSQAELEEECAIERAETLSRTRGGRSRMYKAKACTNAEGPMLPILPVRMASGKLRGTVDRRVKRALRKDSYLFACA